jgi:predicted transcriptional regulator
MPPKRQVPKPTEFELEILGVLWEKTNATVRDVHETLRQHRALGYTSVLKTLQIMTNKGLVTRVESGKAHTYSSAVAQQDTQSRLLQDLSTRLFSGSTMQLAMHALSMQQPSSAELEKIRELIKRKSNQ